MVIHQVFSYYFRLLALTILACVIGISIESKHALANCTNPLLGGGTGNCRSDQYIHPLNATSSQATWGAPSPRVIDIDTGMPISGAVMYVCGRRQKAISKNNGTFPSGFHFCGIRTDKDYHFEIKIRHKNYKPYRFNISVRYGKRVRIPSEIRLRRNHARPLDNNSPLALPYRNPGEKFFIVKVINSITGLPIDDAKVIIKGDSGDTYKLKTDTSGICLLRGHEATNETVRLVQVYTHGGFREWQGSEVFEFSKLRGDKFITIYLIPY